MSNLFVTNVEVREESAPKSVIESGRFEATYYAVLKRRLGRIRARDFLMYGRRFVALCSKVYPGTSITVHENQSVPVGFALRAASLGEYKGITGEILNLEKLTDDAFRAIFDSAFSVVLRVEPKFEREDMRYSFGQMEWTRERSQTIFFYAQGDLLERLLLEKMFYISGVAPSLNYMVGLGVESFLRGAN